MSSFLIQDMTAISCIMNSFNVGYKREQICENNTVVSEPLITMSYDVCDSEK
jgi:hypothetical protein